MYKAKINAKLKNNFSIQKNKSYEVHRKSPDEVSLIIDGRIAYFATNAADDTKEHLDDYFEEID